MRKSVTLFKVLSAMFVLFIASLVAPIIGPSVKGYNMQYDQFFGLVSTTHHQDELAETSEKPSFLSTLRFKLPSFGQSSTFKELEDTLMSPLGVVKVSQPYARVRTSVDLSSEANVAWKSNVGDRFVVIDTDKLGDTTWYKIVKPGTLQEYYYMSSVVTTVMATNTIEIDSVTETALQEMLESYYDAKKDAYEKKDFSYIAPYLIENTKLYNSEYNYLTAATAQETALKFTGHELLSMLYISDTQTWIRVLEAMETLNTAGQIDKLYYISEYVVNTEDVNDIRYYELVNRVQYMPQ